MKKHIFVFGIISVLLVFGLVLTGCDTTTGSTTFGWGKPNPPQTVYATGGSGYIYITWTSVSAATSYTVWRNTTSGGTYSKIGTATGTSYTDYSVTSGVTYYYRVCSVNTSGESDLSSDYDYATASSGSTTPAAPTGVTASVSNTQITITWNTVSGATGYKLEYSKDGKATWTPLSPGGGGNFTSTTVTHGGATGTTGALEPGKTHYYRVRATNSSGDSSYSLIVDATPTTYDDPYELEEDVFMFNSMASSSSVGWEYSADKAHYYCFYASTTGVYDIGWLDSDLSGSYLDSPIANITVSVFDPDNNELVLLQYINTGDYEQNHHSFYVNYVGRVFIDVKPFNTSTSGNYAIAWW